MAEFEVIALGVAVVLLSLGLIGLVLSIASTWIRQRKAPLKIDKMPSFYSIVDPPSGANLYDTVKVSRPTIGPAVVMRPF
jgi:hypothetical protein